MRFDAWLTEPGDGRDPGLATGFLPFPEGMFPRRQVAAIKPEQFARLSHSIVEWAERATVCGPADRSATEACLFNLYRAAGMSAPDRIVHVESPLIAAALRYFLWARDSQWAPDPSLFTAKVGQETAEAVRALAEAFPRDGLGPDAAVRLAGVALVEADHRRRERIEGATVRTVESAMERDRGVRSAARVRDALWNRIQDVDIRTPSMAATQFDGDRLGVSAFFAQEFGIDERGIIAHLVNLSRYVGWCWTGERAAIVSDRPDRFAKDEAGRWHHDTGAAIRYPDGWGLWFLHGVAVPRKLVEAPDSLTVTDIRREGNLEVRRLMLERFGHARFLYEDGAQLVQEDVCGRLYRHVGNSRDGSRILRVRNSTPEPDGSIKEYFLRVPPDMPTARAAVAWTFGLREDQYIPLIES